MRKPPRMEEGEFGLIIELYKEGLSTDEIGRRTYRSNSSIKQVIYRYAPELAKERSGEKSRIREERRIVRDYKSGMKVKQLIHYYGIAYGHLYHILKKYKIKPNRCIKK